MDYAQERYLNDSKFHKLVHQLVLMIEGGDCEEADFVEAMPLVGRIISARRYQKRGEKD